MRLNMLYFTCNKLAICSQIMDIVNSYTSTSSVTTAFILWIDIFSFVSMKESNGFNLMCTKCITYCCTRCLERDLTPKEYSVFQKLKIQGICFVTFSLLRKKVVAGIKPVWLSMLKRLSSQLLTQFVQHDMHSDLVND